MLMSPNKDETSVHGCHCRGDMAVRMHRYCRPRGWCFAFYVCSVTLLSSHIPFLFSIFPYGHFPDLACLSFTHCSCFSWEKHCSCFSWERNWVQLQWRGYSRRPDHPPPCLLFFSFFSTDIRLRMMYYSVMTQAKSEKDIRVLLSGVEPKTFRLLVRTLYH